MRPIFLFISSLALASHAHAGSDPHHAHNHGHAELAVISQGQELVLELRADLADLVGAERAPTTPEEAAALRALHGDFRTGEPPFHLSDRANCVPQSATSEGGYAHLIMLDDADGAAGDEQSDEAHDEHMVTARWTWDCAHPDRLQRIDVTMFERFPAVVEIEVVVLTDDAQMGDKLAPKNAILRMP
ncbi:hypothetical protein PB2503_12149 [Parvularcula bermudensis HTCC2503]|uniref:DUF2796 domain-containing protein n=1 Tax=Parvularcula bermudensis (strain ATCC BAA-594 / HTCC2503 / KCTC 12087) TaxID=314260 RepID=E0TEK0_PARBH|nr:DUF2796 domain-containing protein [Parvularcula bermudensis]ADM10472.1 hypothetical protein PB2503_12149 [Parvularcula bermudensis HTCC2503]